MPFDLWENKANKLFLESPDPLNCFFQIYPEKEKDSNFRIINFKENEIYVLPY